MYKPFLFWLNIVDLYEHYLFVSMWKKELCKTNTWKAASFLLSFRYSVATGWTAYMGIKSINKNSNNHIAMRSIRRIVMHPHYDQYISDYDIALLELEAPIFFNELVQPICLPSSPRVFIYGTVCYVTGWGNTEYFDFNMFFSELAKTLQEAKVKIIDQSICNKLYDDVITSRMLCAGNLNGGIDACQGDSGGPLACLGSGNRWYLTGIVSWGEGCARKNRPGVYTKVEVFVETEVSGMKRIR
uniref:Peptidase S1 domain-containing protein n=1 Tax=Salvator merianae TaxID=96440 RepID=A0A8D0BDH5_SALMN